MHPRYARAHELTRIVIGAAIEVHRLKGAGLLESIYSKCLWRELDLLKIPSKREIIAPIEYKGYRFEEPLRIDLLVDECLLVELKTVDSIQPIHKAQTLSYMHLLDLPLGLLINFNEIVLKSGVNRLILPGADRDILV